MTRHLDPRVKQVLVERLRDQRGGRGLTSAKVREAAAAMGVTEGAVWGWLASGQEAPSSRGRYEVTQADRDAYWAWRGNVAAVRRERLAAGATMPSLRTLHGAFARAMTPAERAAVADGVEGRRRHEVYLRWAPEPATPCGRPTTSSSRCWSSLPRRPTSPPSRRRRCSSTGSRAS